MGTASFSGAAPRGTWYISKLAGDLPDTFFNFILQFKLVSYFQNGEGSIGQRGKEPVMERPQPQWCVGQLHLPENVPTNL